MKRLIAILIMIISLVSYCQNYTNIDNKVLNYPEFKSQKEVAIRITNDFTQKEDKIRALYIWMAENFTYHENKTLFRIPKNIVYYSDHGLKYQVQKMEKERAEKMFQNKNGVCHDFSLLFNELCLLLNIETKIITGVSKKDIKTTLNYPIYKNHSWNAVKINDTWKLLDVTWGNIFLKSKVIDYKDYVNYYFLSNPHDFIKDHFPEESNWQLLQNPVSTKQFYASPIIYPNYKNFKIQLPKNTSGILSMMPNRKVFFDLKLLNKKTKISYKINNSQQLRPLKKRKGKYYAKLKKRTRNNVNTFITLYINYKAILTYKLEY